MKGGRLFVHAVPALTQGHDRFGGCLEKVASFRHIKCRRRLRSQLKILDVRQQRTYQGRWGGGGGGAVVSNLLQLASVQC